MDLIYTRDLSLLTGVINPSHIYDLFTDVQNVIGSMESSNLADNAGIRSRQIADRFVISRNSFILLPICHSNGTVQLTVPTGAAAADAFRIQTALADHFQSTFVGRTGYLAYLASLEARVMYADDDAGSWPALAIYKNATLIGSAQVNFDAATGTTTPASYLLGNSPNLLADPYIPMSDGDILHYQLGRSGGAGNPYVAGIKLTETYKFELID